MNREHPLVLAVGDPAAQSRLLQLGAKPHRRFVCPRRREKEGMTGQHFDDGKYEFSPRRAVASGNSFSHISATSSVRRIVFPVTAELFLLSLYFLLGPFIW